MTEKRIRKIEAQLGDHISHYVQKLIQEKLRLHEHPQIEGEFNGVVFHVTNNSTEEELLTYFDQELDRQRKEYEQSDVYKQRQQEEEVKRIVFNEESAILIDELRNLNFSDYREVLHWTKRYQPYSDYSGVNVPKEEILTLFTKNGYEVNANTYEKFKSEDPENHARWIIGQALDGIDKIGAMHPMVVTFTERWENKFLVK